MKPASFAFCALALVLSVSGVSGCRRYWNEDLSDPAIQARVYHRLKGDPQLDLSRVVVDVHAGVLTVSGMVRSEDERDQIRRLTRMLRGVDQVDINVVIVP